MSNNCQHKNNLQRSGTSRLQRTLKALLPDYVSVDERKIEDLKAFVSEYSKQILFYKQNTNIEDLPSWNHFFNKTIEPKRLTEPHFALFMAFLQLFKIAQNDLNKITQKHLNFYYKDVLQLKEKKAQADQAFVIFELARHVHQHLIPKGTRLKAGKDDSGKELIYQTDRDIVLNKAAVGDIRSLFKDGSGRVYASPVANSSDGKGAEIETSEMSWKTFGKPSGSWPDQDRQQAEIGFAIASPLLKLAEGDREITLTISLKENSSNTLTSLLRTLNLRDTFRIRFSGEEDWIEPEIYESSDDDTGVPSEITDRIFLFLNTAQSWHEIAGIEPQAGPVFNNPDVGYGATGYDIGRATAERILAKRKTLGPDGFNSIDQIKEVQGIGDDKVNDLIYTFRDPGNMTTVDAGNRTITIKRTITKAQDPILSYMQNDEALTDPFETKWPVMKCTLRTDADPYLLNTIQKFEFEKMTLSVHVDDVRELIVQNDQSVMDPGKNFQPFGMQPVLGSNFYIGSAEVFSKRLDMLKLHLTWHGLPDSEKGFEDHYKKYLGPKRTNNSFKANVKLLDKKSWSSLNGTDSSPLFSDDSGELLNKHQITIEDTDKLAGVKRDATLTDADEFDTDTKKGFMKLELSGTDFGHKDYSSSYTKAVMDAFKGNGSTGTDSTLDDNNSNDTQSDDEDNLPNEPYTPLLKEISLEYRSTEEITSEHITGSGAKNNQIEQFFHVGAFGVADRAVSNAKKSTADLFPSHTDEGTLYIGIDNFEAGQNLSLLFRVAEGSADPDLEPQPVRWSYLAGNHWVEFDDFDILSDSTSGLLTSGIIRFSVPKEAGKINTLFPQGKHWIRAGVKEESDAVSDMIQITAQAVSATFKDMGNDPSHLQDALPAGTIGKLKEADSAITSVSQPFSSFGGATKEQDESFYTRVSERLRHKRRAVTIWDYERLVLEAFPSVYKVKCLNHTRFSGSLVSYSELAPGHVTLVAISNVQNVNSVDPLRPKTSLIKLTQIDTFLSGLNSSCVDLHVKNPIYEDIEISLNVKFHEGFDNGFYGKQLEDDLKSFLSPWSNAEGSDLELGGKIHKSVILNYVEERQYVDFLTCFEMRHIITDPTTGEQISRDLVDEAEARTSVSILGSAGQEGRYGDHKIHVLESDDCECDTNEIHTRAAIASIDDCGCSSKTPSES